MEEKNKRTYRCEKITTKEIGIVKNEENEASGKTKKSFREDH